MGEDGEGWTGMEDEDEEEGGMVVGWDCIWANVEELNKGDDSMDLDVGVDGWECEFEWDA